MADLSDIEWTDCTWNPVVGCTIISPGCTNCYAMRMAARLESMALKKYLGSTRKSGGRYVWTNKVSMQQDSLQIPIKWKKPRRIFVNSMSDLFHEKVSEDFIKLVWDVMEECSQHQFQILSKRPERMVKVLSSKNFKKLPNVWLGTSVESKDYKSRISLLSKVPATVRFLSVEPLIGPLGKLNLQNIHWVIVGGESGPNSRPMEKEWVDQIFKQCTLQNVPFFFKQWGGKNKKKSGRNYLGKKWDQFPQLSVV